MAECISKSAFGEPVLRERILSQGFSGERFLYRYVTRYLDSPKVYVVFDVQDRFFQVDVVDPEQPGSRY